MFSIGKGGQMEEGGLEAAKNIFYICTKTFEWFNEK